MDALSLAAALDAAADEIDTRGSLSELAYQLDPSTVQTPALDLLDSRLHDVAEGRITRLIWSMPPQEGKSERVSRRFPLWMLRRNPDTRIAIASYEYGVARRWGRTIRNDIVENPDLGMRIRGDTAAANGWQLEGHRGGVYSVGIGGALTGRPVDMLIIDDPVKGPSQADSEVYRESCWDWWTHVARTRLAPGAPVVIILTRWHEDDLAGRLLASDGGWEVVNVPAQADEADPLGREPGQYLESARGRSQADWEATRRDVGERVWTALYQGRPSPAEGDVLRRGWWQYYRRPLASERADGSMWCLDMDEVIQSWDMTFKDTKSADYVVGQVWGRKGPHAFLLDQVRDRMNFPATVRAVEALSARWPQAHAKLVEDKANGSAVIDQLRSTVPGLIPINPQGSKVARVSAVSPFVEGGNVWLPHPEMAPWIGGFVEECAGFPNGSHDDQVDSMSQALDRLMIHASSALSFLNQLTGAA